MTSPTWPEEHPPPNFIVDTRFLRSDEERHYEVLLEHAPQATFFHTLTYRELLKSFTGAEPLYLTAWEAGALVGALPLFVQQGALGPVVNSLPFFGSYGGFLVDERCDDGTEVIKALIDAWLSFASQAGITVTTIVHSPFEHQQEGIMALYRHEFGDHRIAQVKMLPTPGPRLRDRLLESVRPRCRRAVARAVKRGVSVVRSKDEAMMRKLFLIHQANMSAMGGNHKPWDFFESVLRAYGERDDCGVYYALQDDEVVAALLLFYFKDTVEYFTPCVVTEARSAQPLSLVILESMVDAAEAGYRRYNFEGTWPDQSGVYEFKRNWGTDDFKYNYTVSVHGSSSALRAADPPFLRREYPWFYVIPYHYLA